VRIFLVELDETGEVAHLARCRFNERAALSSQGERIRRSGSMGTCQSSQAEDLPQGH
jgi:hypothetical protein